MKFNIYLKKFGKMIRLYRIERKKSGLYVIPGGVFGKSYISYHEDGKSWNRLQGKIITKFKGTPLSQIIDEVTILNGPHSINAPFPWDKDEADVKISPEDIVIEKSGVFFIEVVS
ncbi:hypothetical protein HUU53_04005 [Candidatus Micrarchaeota archaeon]|nr:hypothetical protein [Candidatus Micrarchaeota archaeon]